jgi:hypothetical protein
MITQRIIPLALLSLVLSACSNQQQVSPDVPERGDKDYFTVRDSIADEVYVSPNAFERERFDSVRKLYIAPANTSQTQIIQPPGVDSSDLDAWVMTPEEDALLQNTLAVAFTESLEIDNSFDVVDRREDAELVLYSTVVALHPNQSRSAASAGARTGGTITMSFALVNPDNGTVAIRILDSKSTDDIVSFNKIQGDMSAVELLLRSWGGQMRRSLMFLQGRYNDPLMGPLQLKPQK